MIVYKEKEIKSISSTRRRNRNGLLFMKYFKYTLVLPVAKSFNVSFWARVRVLLLNFSVLFLLLSHKKKSSTYTEYYCKLRNNFDDFVKALNTFNWFIIYFLLNTINIFITCFKTVSVLKYSNDINKKLNSTFLLPRDKMFGRFFIKQVTYLLLIINDSLLHTMHLFSLPIPLIFCITLMKIFIMCNFFLHSQLFVYPTDATVVCFDKLISTIDTVMNNKSRLAKYWVTEQVLDFTFYFERLKENINGAFSVTIILLLLGNTLPGINSLFKLYIIFKEDLNLGKGVIIKFKNLLSVIVLLFVPFDLFFSSSRVTSQVSLLK